MSRLARRCLAQFGLLLMVPIFMLGMTLAPVWTMFRLGFQVGSDLETAFFRALARDEKDPS